MSLSVCLPAYCQHHYYYHHQQYTTPPHTPVYLLRLVHKSQMKIYKLEQCCSWLIPLQYFELQLYFVIVVCKLGKLNFDCGDFRYKLEIIFPLLMLCNLCVHILDEYIIITCQVEKSFHCRIISQDFYYYIYFGLFTL